MFRTMSSRSFGKSKPSTPTKPEEDRKELVFNDEAAFDAACRDLKSSLKTSGSIDISHIVKVLHIKKEVHDLIEEHFPGAMTGADILAKVAPVIEKYGLTDDNTLFAQSCCPGKFQISSLFYFERLVIMLMILVYYISLNLFYFRRRDQS